MLRRTMQMAIVIALAVGSILVPLAAVGAAAAPSRVTVAVDSANVRSRPSTSSPVVMKVYYGDSVVVTGTTTGDTVEGDSTWYVTKSGYYIADAVVSNTTKTAGQVPTNIPAGNRWVDVNISTLTARAMVGNTVVYSAPIDTGKPGWDTPRGTFTVLRKVAVTDMRSGVGWSEQYVQPAVPWNLFFTNYGHAIHGNYWVPDSWFGTRNTSHGCVGMRVSDAKVFYDFGYVGMRVVIHG